MTSFTFTGLSPNVQTLAANEIGLLGPNAILAPQSGVAVTMAGGTLTNSGTVQGSNAAIAVQITAPGASIFNNGTITGNSSSGVVSFLSAPGETSLTLTNTGMIVGTGAGGADGVLLSGGGNTIINSGSIIGCVDDGIQISSTSGSIRGNEIVNSGTISGLRGIDISSNFGNKIDNSGEILSTGVTAIELGGQADDAVINTGTIHGNILLGDGDDTFTGTDGTLVGNVQGGVGNDLYITDDSTLAVVELAGEGLDTVQASVDYSLDASQEIEALVLTGAAVLGSGNDLANTITGNDQANILSGNAGADTILGGLGDDRLDGGVDNDSLSGGANEDRLQGSDGNDTLTGEGGNDTLLGEVGNDSLAGGAGDDMLKGAGGNDTLSGGDGDDILTGGKGRDTMNGGNDEDTFVFLKLSDTGLVASNSNDIINGFVSGSDRIDLSAIDAKTGTAGDDAFTFLGSGAFTGVAGQLHTRVSGANLILEGDVTGDGVADFQIQLNGLGTIGAGDLIL